MQNSVQIDESNPTDSFGPIFLFFIDFFGSLSEKTKILDLLAKKKTVKN